MIHEILPVGMLECNCSLLGDESTGEAMVIDPGDEVDEILALADRHGLRIQSIVVTHGHIDHIGGAARLKAATGAPLHMNASDQEIYTRIEEYAAWLGVPAPARTSVDVEVRDGDRLLLGASDLRVLHTPGHTPGSLCLWIPGETKLLSGDTLFRDSIGRTDLPGGDSRRILESIREKLLPLPEETVVVPGHGPVTTLGREKEFNYFLKEL